MEESPKDQLSSGESLTIYRWEVKPISGRELSKVAQLDSNFWDGRQGYRAHFLSMLVLLDPFATLFTEELAWL